MPQDTAETNLEEVVETTDSLEIADEQDNIESNGNAEVNEEVFEDNTDAESKGQSKEENAKFAKERREREKQQKAAKDKEAEAQRKRELEEVRFSAIKEALGGVNPYTNEKIEDKYDMDEYLTMKEMEKKGLDPLQDYASYLKQKQRNESIESEKKAKEKSKEKWIENDRKEFFDKYPDVDFETLAKDDMFKMFAQGKIGNMSMASIYEGYKEVQATIDKKAKEVAKRLVANKQASPGSLSTSSDVPNAFYTLDELKKLSKEEVRRNYDKVIASQKRLKEK
jgi:hypothetical protein